MAAIELAKDGHSISLCDISSSCLDLAVKKFLNADLKPTAALHANVLDFTEPKDHPRVAELADREHDILLLLGPLYHILERSARMAAILEVSQMLKSGGFLVAAFVTRNAHLRDLAVRDPERLL